MPRLTWMAWSDGHEVPVGRPVRDEMGDHVGIELEVIAKKRVKPPLIYRAVNRLPVCELLSKSRL